MSVIVENPSPPEAAAQQVDQPASNLLAENPAETPLPDAVVEGVEEQDRLAVIKQVEFYLSDANLPFDKFMFMLTSPHLDPNKAPTLSPEARKKAESYGPGCSPVLLQVVASFKRMRPYSQKFPTKKIAEILQTSRTDPKLLDVITEEVNGKPTYYIKRIPKLEETNRAGASDRCVYVKGFLPDDQLTKEEPADIQVRLEKWARQWGDICVLRMRRDMHQNGAKSEGGGQSRKGARKWKNSVFVEYSQATAAEQLVEEFQRGTKKPTFEGHELSSIMFKIDYVTKKAEEKGVPVPLTVGRRKTLDPTKSVMGALGGNNSHFNAFEEMKAVADGRQKYVGGGRKSGEQRKGQNVSQSSQKKNDKDATHESEKDDPIKSDSQPKDLPENVLFGFGLEGEAPDSPEAVPKKFGELKSLIGEGDIRCRFLSFDPDTDASGYLVFSKPVDDVEFEKLQTKKIKVGGRVMVFKRLQDDEARRYRADFASKTANSSSGAGNGNGQRGNKHSKQAGAGRKESRRGNGHKSWNGGRSKDKDLEASAKNEPGATNDPTVSSAKKRDAEGNLIGTNGCGPPSTDHVPEIGRAEKKTKTDG